MKNRKVPINAIRRLAVYYQAIEKLIEEGCEYTSSAQLAQMLDFTPSLIRQDLNYFGAFGYQGYGYRLTELRDYISQILDISEQKRMILVGTGALGIALSELVEAEQYGFSLTDVFGASARPYGLSQKVNYHNADSLEEFLSTTHVDTAAVCTDDARAREAVDMLVRKGVKYIWNLTNTHVQNDVAGVFIDNLNLFSALSVFSYNMNSSAALNHIGQRALA